MSDTDESAVLVEMVVVDDVDAAPELVNEGETSFPTTFAEAFQVVSIGGEEDKYAFTYHEEKLDEILRKIPPEVRVCVVSVVGAFRTGKSFLLSWFLRYFEHHSAQNPNSNTASPSPWYETFQSLGNDGFEWRGGSERNTTGIWIWSEPQFIQNHVDGEKLAVLLVDTQGMFDNETTMAVTASIFGISTLLSSYQIYNVDKRIQEDNLQQLSLFSEYARLAISSNESNQQLSSTTIQDNNNIQQKPFQHIEFLVRDWQNFDDEESLVAMEESMTKYLDTVISERTASDLQDTRNQIISCFDEITCYGLCHPGKYVTKKTYSGDVGNIDNQFLRMLDHYCRRVFDCKTLKPKVIHGRQVTSIELAVYMKEYAKLFASGAGFPTASTMLDATTTANNTNATRMANDAYKEEMSKIAGPRCRDYVSHLNLEETHMRSFLRSQAIFDSVANFGSKRSIEEAKESFVKQIEAEFEVYQSLNEGRNPLAGWET
jgi:atlastin